MTESQTLNLLTNFMINSTFLGLLACLCLTVYASSSLTGAVSGVPQGSILGTVLFNLFVVKGFANLIGTGCAFFAYADDIFLFCADNANNFLLSESNINEFLVIVTSCMIDKMLAPVTLKPYSSILPMIL